jgi:hypothetical protein
MGAPHPRFPVKVTGFRELYAPFLKERRTRCLVQCRVQEIRGISLVFREMWDTTAFDLRILRSNSSRTSLRKLSRLLALAHAATLCCAGRLGLSLLFALSAKRNLFLARRFSGNFFAAIPACWFLPAASLFMFALARNRLIPRPTARRLCIGLRALLCSHTSEMQTHNCCSARFCPN